MKDREDYADYICEMSNLLKKGAKISMKSLFTFDKEFDEYEADAVWLFPYLMGELISHNNLDTIEKQLEFLDQHFERDLIHDLTMYYIEDFYGIDYINSFNDLKKLDKISGTDFCGYYADKDIYLNILDKYELFYEDYEDGDEGFARDLKMLDRIDPEKNHIANCLIYILNKRENDKAEEIFEAFRIFFNEEELYKNAILKNYLTENGLTGLLEQIEEKEFPTL